jgi:N-acetyl-anhydromuramyl-L-alanine amidase AmpD
MGRYFLLDHRVGARTWYTSRLSPLRVIVVHITAGLEDFHGADDSAEATARYAATTTRQVSWHAGVDGDSVVELLPAEYTAWHCRGANSWSYGVELSKADTDWRDAPEPWRDRILTLAAEHCAQVAAAAGIPLRKLSARQALDGLSGFVGHWELDPSRRTDPGRVAGVGETFPWDEFVHRMEGNEVVTDDDVARIAKAVLASKLEVESPWNGRGRKLTVQRAVEEAWQRSQKNGVVLEQRIAGMVRDAVRAELDAAGVTGDGG